MTALWGILCLLLHWLGATLGNRGNDTAVSIPMLYPYKNCNSSTLSSLDYRLYFSESLNTSTVFYGYTNSDPNTIQVGYQAEFRHTFYWQFFNAVDPINSPQYQCTNLVFGLYVYFLYNPTVSSVVTLSAPTLSTFEAISLLPVPSYLNLPVYETELFEYNVMFQSRHDEFLHGIAISAVVDNTNITIQATAGAITLRNAKDEKTVIFSNETSTFSIFNLFEVLWLEPKVANCNLPSPSLQGTKITSTKPLSVFTTKVKCNDTGDFSYDLQLVHQMPPVTKWGTNFILDMQQANIIPPSLASYLHYQFTILTSDNDTTNITIEYYHLGDPLHLISPKTQLFSASSNEELKIPVAEMPSDSLSHFNIHASAPVLVMYEIYTRSKGELSYSILLQPTEWFSRQQSLVLSHSQPSSEYRYHIGVVIPKNYFNPADISIENVQESSPPETLDTYQGYNGQVFVTTDYAVLYLEVTIHNESSNQTQLLLQHSSSCGVLGATVYSYAESGVHYAYSNSYILGNTTDAKLCPSPSPPPITPAVNHTSCPPLLEIVIGLVLLAIALAVGGVIVCILVVKYLQRKNRDSLQLLEPLYDYAFDVFLSFADEDKTFVTNNIYTPLENKGYRVFWHHEHFKPGIEIVENIARAVRVSRRIVFVCTESFGESDFCLKELAYCLDVQRKEKTRRIIPVVVKEEFCPRELMGFNQIRIDQRDDMSAEEVENFIAKLNLGDPVDSSVKV